MNIEKVKVLKALKCGDTVYKKGQIIDRPIPPDIVQEVRNDTGTVEVLSEWTPTVSEEEIIEKIEPEPEPEPEPEEIKPIEAVSEKNVEIIKEEPAPIIEEEAETKEDEKVSKPTSVLKHKPRKNTQKKKTVKKKVVRSNK